MIAGDHALVESWLRAARFQGEESVDAFEIAKLRAVSVMGRSDASATIQTTAQDELVEAAKSDRQKRDAAKLLMLWQGFDLRLASEARTLMTDYGDQGDPLNAGQLSAIEAAAREQAIGEAALRILAATNRSPDKVSPRDMGALISALRRLGADDIARTLAVEAMAL